MRKNPSIHPNKETGPWRIPFRFSPCRTGQLFLLRGRYGESARSSTGKNSLLSTALLKKRTAPQGAASQQGGNDPSSGREAGKRIEIKLAQRG
jgi:hypothetical protein